VEEQTLEETSYDAFLHTEVLSYSDIKTAPLFNTLYDMHKSQNQTKPNQTKPNQLYSITALSLNT
jgi:hypothetical protein